MYGWEAYLSERDQEHDKLWGKKELAGFGKKPALLLIDIYYSVLGLTREPILESVRKWPMSTGLEGWQAVDETVGLLAAARENGIPVIHVKGLHTGVVHWGRGGGRKGEIPLTEEEKRLGTQIVDEVKPLPGELVIEKAAASAFHGTPLLFQLNALGIDTVICAGETTSGCVRATVVDGATFRFKMGAVSECCFDRTEASHYMNLYDMHQKYADVVNKEQAIAYFRSLAAERKAVSQAI
ncbi:isochorismatase family protein [Paenibacillus cremeus]|uniref:Isochorismatase family protein n=1 Tax=Paenibacillus cremeus TaxID=2163881 RepID=A0A559K6Y9_9BACL|nr:isochorismatase family protein [Paenibacillus cremeus]TVY07905.1 isochorismatase family protein [Paenibacillus cremeus]